MGSSLFFRLVARNHDPSRPPVSDRSNVGANSAGELLDWAANRSAKLTEEET